MPLRNFTARLHAIWLGLPGNLRGALWVTAGTVLFAINDAAVKFLGKNISPVEMAAFRYVIGFLLMLPMFMRLGWDGIKTDRLLLHVFRAIIACLAQVGVFYAVVHLLLADATAIAFSRPLFMTVLAVIVLREAVGWRRWTATSIGFVGVLIMARPGQTTFDPISLVAIASAFAFALAVVLIRRLGTTDSPTQIMFYYQLGGVVLFVPTAPFFWTMPTLIQWPPLLMIGVLSTAAMFCFVQGYYAGEASAVGPTEYTRIVYAVLIGFFLFSEVPDLWTVAGAFVIIGAILYIARHEAAKASRDGAGSPAG